ncbi:hypothetical protein [Lysobacter gummosus]|uniref:hypothetical protein n=1 Tax=Lysobacter gummosus TaxID=262324 RepID=UPI0036404BE4
MICAVGTAGNCTQGRSSTVIAMRRSGAVLACGAAAAALPASSNRAAKRQRKSVEWASVEWSVANGRMRTSDRGCADHRRAGAACLSPRFAVAAWVAKWPVAFAARVLGRGPACAAEPGARLSRACAK